MKIAWILPLILCLAGCSLWSDPNLALPTSRPTNLEQLAPTSSPSPQPGPTATIPSSPSPTLTPTPAWQICSPLAGVTLDEIPARIVNPYHPPSPGSDDPHQGVDLADLQPGTTIATSGLPVHAVLGGKIAGVINDRFPYGNAIIIETSLKNWPDSKAILPTPAPTLEAIPVLTCPELPTPAGDSSQERTLYLLYAHLEKTPSFQPGESVQCGDVLGAIGASGNALNPHLHLEARLGPAGFQFPGLAHYDASASQAEMAYYCLWRVNGLFQHIDPIAFLIKLTSEASP